MRGIDGGTEEGQREGGGEEGQDGGREGRIDLQYSHPKSNSKIRCSGRIRRDTKGFVWSTPLPPNHRSPRKAIL